MKDQVASLSARGLAVGCITQESSEEERAKVKNGQYQLMLFSPEALLSFRRWRELLQGEGYSLGSWLLSWMRHTVSRNGKY